MASRDSSQGTAPTRSQAVRARGCPPYGPSTGTRAAPLPPCRVAGSEYLKAQMMLQDDQATVGLIGCMLDMQADVDAQIVRNLDDWVWHWARANAKAIASSLKIRIAVGDMDGL